MSPGLSNSEVNVDGGVRNSETTTVLTRSRKWRNGVIGRVETINQGMTVDTNKVEWVIVTTRQQELRLQKAIRRERTLEK
jgi:hypothetical protein